MPEQKEIEPWEKEFDLKIKELKDQQPALLRESEPVEFGYTVDRDYEIFRVVDFGNIKSFFRKTLSTLRTQEREATIEKVNGMKKYTNSGITNMDFNDKEAVGFNSAIDSVLTLLEKPL